MSSKGKESKSPAPAAKENKSPDKLLTAESSSANEKNPFYLSKIEPLGGQNDKLRPDHQSDIFNNSEQLSTKNGSLAGHKQTSQQINFEVVPFKGSDQESTTESHGKTRSSDTSQSQPEATQKSGVTSHPHQSAFEVKLFPDLEKVPDSTQKSGVNLQPQSKDTPQKSGASQQQPKATDQKSRVTSHPHQDAFQVKLFPDQEETARALKTENTEKKQTSSSVKPKKDEKKTSSSARGPFAPK